MAKFKPAVERILQKKICYKCNSRNPVKADRCRKCGYKNLRDKAQESRGT